MRKSTHQAACTSNAVTSCCGAHVCYGCDGTYWKCLWVQRMGCWRHNLMAVPRIYRDLCRSYWGIACCKRQRGGGGTGSGAWVGAHGASSQAVMAGELVRRGWAGVVAPGGWTEPRRRDGRCTDPQKSRRRLPETDSCAGGVLLLSLLREEYRIDDEMKTKQYLVQARRCVLVSIALCKIPHGELMINALPVQGTSGSLPAGLLISREWSDAAVNPKSLSAAAHELACVPGCRAIGNRASRSSPRQGIEA